MLNDLKVLNGNLELKFNMYTYLYTITVDSDVSSLELEYVVEDGYYINVIDNELDEYENYVYLNVYNASESTTYTLIVYKENSEEVSMIDEYLNSLEVEVEEVPFYEYELLCVGVFLFIVIAFSIIFRRKKKRK